MLRRCQFLLVSLAVCVASVLPSFAWSEESFVGKDKLEEMGFHEADLPLTERSVKFSSPRSSYTSSLVSGSFKFYDVIPSLPNKLFSYVSFDMSVDVPGGSYETSGAISYPDDGISGSVLYASVGQVLYSYYPIVFSPSGSLDYSNPVARPVFSGGNRLLFSYDVSSFNSSVFSFDGSICPLIYYFDGTSFVNFRPDSLDIFVDGISVKHYSSESGLFLFDGYVYSGSSSAETVSLSFGFSEASNVGFSISEGVSYEIVCVLEPSSDATLTFLSAQGSGPPGGMVDADNTLGDYDAVEDQYFDDAESAVGGLDTSVPDGMLGSAAMIGGMFNDLWTVLGDFSLIYFIPLLFSFFLWIIGRKRGGSG